MGLMKNTMIERALFEDGTKGRMNSRDEYSSYSEAIQSEDH